MATVTRIFANYDARVASGARIEVNADVRAATLTAMSSAPSSAVVGFTREHVMCARHGTIGELRFFDLTATVAPLLPCALCAAEGGKPGALRVRTEAARIAEKSERVRLATEARADSAPAETTPRKR